VRYVKQAAGGVDRGAVSSIAHIVPDGVLLQLGIVSYFE
jgi:hypothetical protein